MAIFIYVRIYMYEPVLGRDFAAYFYDQRPGAQTEELFHPFFFSNLSCLIATFLDKCIVLTTNEAICQF